MNLSKIVNHKLFLKFKELQGHLFFSLRFEGSSFFKETISFFSVFVLPLTLSQLSLGSFHIRASYAKLDGILCSRERLQVTLLFFFVFTQAIGCVILGVLFSIESCWFLRSLTLFSTSFKNGFVSRGLFLGNFGPETGSCMINVPLTNFQLTCSVVVELIRLRSFYKLN